MKTIYDIKTDIYKYLKTSKLAKAVNGEVIKNKRTGNGNEDVVIQTPAEALFGEIQDIILYVNIYTQDVKKGAEFVESERIKPLCKTAYEVLKSYHGDTFVIHAESQQIFEVEATHEHVISTRIKYQNYESNY